MTVRKIGVALLLIAAAGGGFWLNRSLEQSAAPESSLPAAQANIAFALPDLQGNVREFAEWDGKVRLVNFWATWCAPCRREIPLLKDTQEKHGEHTLQVIGVAVDSVEDVMEYAKTARFNYPVLIGQDDAIAAAETAGIDFIGLPVTLLVSADGQLIKTHMGELHAEQLAEMVDVVIRLRQDKLDLSGARKALAQL